jgi:hypothetical protein
LLVHALARKVAIDTVPGHGSRVIVQLPVQRRALMNEAMSG